MLAGVSVEYYAKLERGDLAGASEASWTRSLTPSTSTTPNVTTCSTSPAMPTPHRPDADDAASGSAFVRPGLQYTLDAITGGPALVRNGRLDIIAANTLGRALHAPAHAGARRPVNLARHCFLDRESAEDFYPDWDDAADAIVAILRAEAGRDPYDKDLRILIGELSTLSEEFRTKWGTHDVRRHATGEKHFNHPVVGPARPPLRKRRPRRRPGLEAAHLHRRTRLTDRRRTRAPGQLGSRRRSIPRSLPRGGRAAWTAHAAAR